jgi:hypothetical protein
VPAGKNRDDSRVHPGTLSLTFEEGTSAAWLHDLLKPHVSRLVVCDPHKAALLKEGNKSDRIDARKLAESLRTNQLKPVRALRGRRDTLMSKDDLVPWGPEVLDDPWSLATAQDDEEAYQHRS